jgi:hypothetical protein
MIRSIRVYGRWRLALFDVTFLLFPPRIAISQAAKPISVANHTMRIRILNARTNKPVVNERLNVSLHRDQVGFTVMPSDKDGTILVDTGDATEVHVLANFYADCRSRGELYRNYSLAAIWSSGITAGNLCSSANPASKPGELVLFVIPKTYVPTMGQPPATSFPHSDENPNLH